MFTEIDYNKPASRESTLDYLRGVGVLLMVFAHTVYFLHDGSDNLSGIIARLSNMIVFTLLVFVSGSASYYALMSHSGNIIPPAIRRIITLLAGYYLIATIGSLGDFNIISWESTVMLFKEILFFIRVPSFSEFLLPFIIFSLILLLNNKFIHFITSRLIFILILSVFLYVFGIIIYSLQTPLILTNVKAIFAGHEGLLRFPVFQYSPVFLIGLWWGKYLFQVPEKFRRDKTAVSAMLIFGMITSFSVIFYNFSGNSLFNPVSRWPPSPGFLTAGLTAVFAFYLTLSNIPKPKIATWIFGYLGYLGKDAYDLYLVHIIILFIYERFSGQTFSSPFIIALMYLSILSLSSLISSFNMSYSASLFRPVTVSFGTFGRYRLKKRYLLVAGAVAAVSFWYALSDDSSVYGNIIPAKDVELLIPENIRQANIEPDCLWELSTNRSWFLRTLPSGHSPQSNLTISLKGTRPDNYITDGQNIWNYFLTVSGPSAQVATYRISCSTSEIGVPMEKYPAGDYSVRLYGRINGIGKDLQAAMIHVSEPMLVAWTLDWEGFGVSANSLSEIDRISSGHHDLPVTHFFNPKFLTGDDTAGASPEKLVSYLTDRISLRGDAVNLHLHAYYDIASQSGVMPLSEPAWGYRHNTGYDVPLTSYPENEIRQMLIFSLQKFSQWSLPAPRGFRAGGWYADDKVFRALAGTGFYYDSSGRDNGKWNTRIANPWNLAVTAQPYAMSQTGIWEIPNNGGNTYEHTPQKLISGFIANGGDNTLESKKAIVYLSHPDWAEREFPKINDVLTFIDNHSYLSDRGPAIYVTTDTVYDLMTDK